MIKRILPWVIILALAAGGFTWWRKSQTAQAAGEIAYRTATAQRGDVTQSVAASGTLSAITTVEVGSQVSGQIEKLHADFNATVKQDQVVAEIEPSTYESRVLQAEADLASARSTLELKQLNAKRAGELLKKELISQADHDQTLTELRQQESTVRIKDAALKSAQVDLGRTKIRSPIDGVVISRDIDVGQTVQASFSAPKLFTIAKDLREMQITASVSEADIGTVAAGQKVTFTVDAFPGQNFSGTVREVRNNPTTTNNVVNYSTMIDVQNPELKLRPGMTANVTITTARRANVVRIANSALRFRPPEGAPVLTAPAAPGAEGAADAPPEPPADGPNLDDMPAEIRERMLADFDKNKDGKLDADERKTMREQMQARMGAGAGGRGGLPGGGGGSLPGGGMGGGGAAGPRPRPQNSSTPQTRTVYVVTGAAANSTRATGPLTATTVRTGLADSGHTEIISGLPEGAVVATGTTTAAAEPAAASTNNPFAPRPPAGKSR